jgi:hypothetical protein
MLRTANRWGFKQDVIRFLKLFDADEEFHSATDFQNRCSELARLIRDEKPSAKLSGRLQGTRLHKSLSIYLDCDA